MDTGLFKFINVVTRVWLITIIIYVLIREPNDTLMIYNIYFFIIPYPFHSKDCYVQNWNKGSKMPISKKGRSGLVGPATPEESCTPVLRTAHLRHLENLTAIRLSSS
jgi:hypothetical protein